MNGFAKTATFKANFCCHTIFLSTNAKCGKKQFEAAGIVPGSAGRKAGMLSTMPPVATFM